MKLTEKDYAILDFIVSQQMSTTPKIAKATGYSPQSVRTSLRKLVKAGMIQEDSNPMRITFWRKR